MNEEVNRAMSRDSSEIHIETFNFEQGDSIPNHPRWPLLIYREVLLNQNEVSVDRVRNVLKGNNWSGIWRNGIYGYHHYHSTAHEVLVMAEGKASVRFGGPQGTNVEFSKGSVAILPAGTGHKRLASSNDYLVIGGYPNGQNWDMQDGSEEVTGPIKTNISNVGRPSHDPVYGHDGPLMNYWKK